MVFKWLESIMVMFQSLCCEFSVTVELSMEYFDANICTSYTKINLICGNFYLGTLWS